MSERVPMTRQGYDKLEADLRELKTVDRPQIVREIEIARAHGDISENAEFHAAKERQSHIEGRIRQLEDMLRRAQVGETPADDGIVEPGMQVTYKFAGDSDADAETFLLGAREMADTTNLQVFSPQSPLGSAIIGKRKGETVPYTAPNGKTLEVEILDAVPYTG